MARNRHRAKMDLLFVVLIVVDWFADVAVGAYAFVRSVRTSYHEAPEIDGS